MYVSKIVVGKKKKKKGQEIAHEINLHTTLDKTHYTQYAWSIIIPRMSITSNHRGSCLQTSQSSSFLRLWNSLCPVKKYQI